MATPSKTIALELYRTMRRIRRFEETVERLHRSGQAPGLLHLAIGQEAVSAGVIAALEPADYIASHHRGHGHCIAKGSDLTQLFAELLGRRSALGLGRSGSMHLYDREHGNLGTNAIVGGSVPLATGAGLTARVLGTGRVAVSFFGDGVLNQGLLFECLNMAMVWRLPVVFVCENNGYGEFTAIGTVTAGASFLDRGRAFSIPSQQVDGMDALSVHEAARAAVARARAGEGPTFLVCDTWRFTGHHISDRQDYKEDEEQARWRARDPIPNLRRQLTEYGVAGDRLDAIDRDVAAEVDAAARAAAAMPAPGPDDLFVHLYAHA